MYSQFKDRTVEKLIDIAFNQKHYLQYEDLFTNYEIWHKKPSEYGDSIKGELKFYDEEKNAKYHLKKYNSIKKIDQYENLKEYAKEVLNGYSESITYEWTEYKL